MDSLEITEATGPTPEIAALLQAHFELMRATSPAESCHVMAPQAVFEEADVVLAAHIGGTVVGIGALKSLSPDHAELKSMYTTAAARGQGVGTAILKALMDRSRSIGHRAISLETGSMAEFAAARALYAAQGFAECPPFGKYTSDPLSTFMSRAL